MTKFSLDAFVRVAAVGIFFVALVGIADARTPPQAAVSVPEIGTASVASAVALLGFGAMALRGRWRNRR